MPTVTITEVRNAKSLNAENTVFDVEINHPEHNWIPYSLNPDDTDMTIDNSVLLGLIGSDYAAYVAPTQAEIDAELSENLRNQRDQKLAEEVDPIAGNALRWAALTDAQRTAWGNYRTALLDLPTQSGFPDTVAWPTKPT
tara:strand:+ start:242 stop:661 length:420 start_codon:yes stop_codon:yes gene_type:complete